ncbi:DUF3078 domain-containing protein [Allomuricauda sp. d1]|uniref:DUF3078 domain-containing protein n=1 Tax=Allomuricauda sp. d1 TaxID=3136725 RepID=UPI0031CF231C
MNSKKILFLFLLICFASFAQDSIPETDEDSLWANTTVIRFQQKAVKPIPRGVRLANPRISFKHTKPWLKKYKRFVPFSFWEDINEFGLTINEVAFINWNAGGENSVSALARLNFTRNYKFRYITWSNELRLRYGLNAQEGREVRKTEDLIRLTSSFGFRRDTLSHWYYSAKINFNTQFSNGFKYPNTENPISRFMAPGYLFLGAGTTFAPEKTKFNLYLSPLTYKATFVLDEALSNQGAFGVEEGERIFAELGFLVTNTWEEEIFKNVLLNHRLTLYTDYLRSFGNIDVDWELNFNLKVNEYISANIGTHLIFDDDIKFDEEVADDGTVINPGEPRIQFKQVLGVGFVYNF